jgi:hypothetical protein
MRLDRQDRDGNERNDGKREAKVRMIRVDTGGWRGSWLLRGGEARAKVRMSVSVSVKETSRRRRTAESGGCGKWLKQREVRALYAKTGASPGGDTRLSAKRTATSGCSDT